MYYPIKHILLAAIFSCLLAWLPANAQKPFSRDIETISFIPKGQWITGVSVNYSQSDEDNYQFLIIENLNGSSYSFKVSPMLFYAVDDDIALGGRFGYSRQQTKLDKGLVKIDSETDWDIDQLFSVSQTYSATAAFRNYISFGNNTRFGMFNEVQLSFAGGQSKLTNGTGTDFTGTFQKNFSFDIGVSPGFIMFLNNYSALEVNVGVLGFSYHHTKATTDRIYVADLKSKYANFKVNLFSITFGVSFYL